MGTILLLTVSRSAPPPPPTSGFRLRWVGETTDGRTWFAGFIALPSGRRRATWSGEERDAEVFATREEAETARATWAAYSSVLPEIVPLALHGAA